jgi:DNA polymerase-3 subunit delta'
MLNIEKIYPSLPWLEEPRAQLTGMVEQDRCPHALLIQGQAGTGRRHLALWLATELLGTNPAASFAGDPDTEVGNPDFITLEPEPDKQSISVDQVREFIGFFRLTSHGSRGRVAIVYPADSMTVNAANSLLKTLEEPPAGTLIILITESLKRLPSTVVSRCHRVRIPAPSKPQALAWLKQQAPEKDLDTMLDFAGGAPLATLDLHRSDFASTANDYAADLKKLEHRGISPVVVAERWGKKQPELALQWLYWRLARRVRALLEEPFGQETAKNSQKSSQIHACFRQMTQIRELRRLIKRGINAELNLASLLMDWYGGLGSNARSGL